MINYEKERLKQIIIIGLLIITTALIFIYSISSGRFSIDFKDVINVIFGHTEGISKNIQAIILNSRIPRGMGAFIVGMALSCSGATYQSMFQNPMASPDILGAASGAGFGAAIALLLNFTDFWVQVTSFVFGIVAVILTYFISKVVSKGYQSLIILLLVGIVVSALFDAMISMTKYFADVDNQLPAITFWLMGGLSNITMDQVMYILPIILIGIVFIHFMSWHLNVMSFGDEEAMALGINVRLKRMLIITFSTLICSAAISICGLIGWVGIVIPHIARMLAGSNYSKMLPIATLLGGIYMMIIDDMARNLFRVEVPLGILTALVGAPFFVFLIFKKRYSGN